MKWQHKALAQAVLSRVPFGEEIHRKLQDVAGTSRLKEEHYVSKARFVRRGIEHGLCVEGGAILEIGTGWHPVMPLLLSLLDARRVVTVDIHPWLTRRSLNETLSLLLAGAERIAQELNLSAASVREQFSRLSAAARDPNSSVESVLASARIERLYPVNARDTKLPAASVDCVLSYNVFEHVLREDVAGILRESKRIARPDSFHLHRIHTDDHFAHVDPRITSVNFLKYSPEKWKWIGGSGLAYHNRLRGIDFLRLFQQAGYAVLDWEVTTDRRALAALREGQVVPHPNWEGYSPEELCSVMLNVYACVPEPAAVRAA